MDRLQAIEAFVRVVERRSFAAAARDLSSSRALVSKQIQLLETRLGVRLLNRTTRQVSLTEAGQAYYERCLRVLEEVAAADDAAAAQQHEPSGRLRINAPTSFGRLHLAGAVADFLSRHPAVEIDLTLEDRQVDLVAEGFDLAVRIARLPDSSLIARRLAPCRLVLCASPAYLAARGTPGSVAELAHHRCLIYAYGAQRNDWRLDGPDGPASVRVGGHFRANNGDVIQELALAGQGIALQPTFMAGPELRRGALVQVLPGYEPPPLAIQAVYPHARLLPARVRAFLDFLAARYAQEPPWDEW